MIFDVIYKYVVLHFLFVVGHS